MDAFFFSSSWPTAQSLFTVRLSWPRSVRSVLALTLRTKRKRTRVDRNTKQRLKPQPLCAGPLRVKELITQRINWQSSDDDHIVLAARAFSEGKRKCAHRNFVHAMRTVQLL